MGAKSFSFLVVGLTTTSVLLAFGAAGRRFGQASLVILVLVYLALSLPYVAERLAATLSIRRSPPLVEALVRPSSCAIVIFSGDYPGGRISEAVRLYRNTDARWVIVSGSPALSERLVARGISRERILWDPRPRTTREQAILLGPLLRARAIDAFVLIASSIHMRRALAAVEATGLDPFPVESPVAMPWVPAGDSRFLPHRAALRLSHEVFYEYLALALYKSRSWLGPVDHRAIGD